MQESDILFETYDEESQVDVSCNDQDEISRNSSQLSMKRFQCMASRSYRYNQILCFTLETYNFKGKCLQLHQACGGQWWDHLLLDIKLVSLWKDQGLLERREHRINGNQFLIHASGAMGHWPLDPATRKIGETGSNLLLPHIASDQRSRRWTTLVTWGQIGVQLLNQKDVWSLVQHGTIGHLAQRSLVQRWYTQA